MPRSNHNKPVYYQTLYASLMPLGQECMKDWAIFHRPLLPPLFFHLPSSNHLLLCISRDLIVCLHVLMKLVRSYLHFELIHSVEGRRSLLLEKWEGKEKGVAAFQHCLFLAVITLAPSYVAFSLHRKDRNKSQPKIEQPLLL